MQMCSGAAVCCTCAQHPPMCTAGELHSVHAQCAVPWFAGGQGPAALAAMGAARRQPSTPLFPGVCLPACSFIYHSPLPLPPCCSLRIHCAPAFVPLPVDGVPAVVLCEPVCFQDVCLVRCDRVSGQTGALCIAVPNCPPSLHSACACPGAGLPTLLRRPSPVMGSMHRRRQPRLWLLSRRHMLLCIAVSLPRC